MTLPLLHSGKVRELYDLGDDLLMVASDRISTYDVVHPTPIPDKGRVLTGLSVLWFGLTRVIVPMARPGIAAAALFLFFNSWNDYYGPLLYTSENSAWWPVAYGLATFRGSHSSNWGLTMAITMLVMIPVVLIFFFAQRVFVEGITLTGVKG